MSKASVSRHWAVEHQVLSLIPRSERQSTHKGSRTQSCPSGGGGQRPSILSTWWKYTEPLPVCHLWCSCPHHVGGSCWTIIIFPMDFRWIAFIWWAWFRWGRYFVPKLQFLICYDFHKTLGIRKLGRSTFNVFFKNCFDEPTKILVSLSITNFKSHIFMVENQH